MTEERKKELHNFHIEHGKAHADNLTDLRTVDEARRKEIASKGGKASVEARRRKRDIKQIFDDILSLDATELTTDETIQSIARQLKSKGLKPDAYTMINTVQTIKAMQGSTKSAEYVRDTVGDKPDNRLSIEADITTDSDRELMQSLSNRIESLEAIETSAKPLE